MSRVKRSVDVEYDTSNNMLYVIVPVIYSWNNGEAKTEVWHSAFTTLGAAQAFFSHLSDRGLNNGQWIKESIRGSDHWVLYLNPKNETKGYKVVLEETLLVER